MCSAVQNFVHGLSSYVFIFQGKPTLMSSSTVPVLSLRYPAKYPAPSSFRLHQPCQETTLSCQETVFQLSLKAALRYELPVSGLKTKSTTLSSFSDARWDYEEKLFCTFPSQRNLLSPTEGLHSPSHTLILLVPFCV